MPDLGVVEVTYTTSADKAVSLYVEGPDGRLVDFASASDSGAALQARIDDNRRIAAQQAMLQQMFTALGAAAIQRSLPLSPTPTPDPVPPAAAPSSQPPP